MSRIQQDQFVDDEEEECCPLCVEEFDLSDKNFRPCPCGYQICQFCFNNIRTTMNGLCPACRRPYDESTIEFKNITPEEMAKHKQQIQQKAKKNAAMRQKEAQKAEADSLSRKHLSGLRVVQKNLVYVTGLTPTIREDRLLETLRGPDYFGQYGKIIKIVVSKAKENAQHQQSVGVYVTFARKEDAGNCIAAVDGSQNGDRTLRAQYGTTKYCSAYLRGEQCNNRNCMFLHEPGEENDSFTRHDLSLMNSISTQQPALSQTSSAAPPPHRGPAVAAATPMNRQDSSEAHSPTSGGDVPALPATASWGSRTNLERRASRSTDASNPSPMTSNVLPAQPPKPNKAEEQPKKKGKEKEKSEQSSKPTTPQPTLVKDSSKSKLTGLDNLLKAISSPDFKFIFSGAILSQEELREITNFPQLLDPNGGAKRRATKEKLREREIELQAQRETESQPSALPATEVEREDYNEATAGGSLQLGGEPEERHDPITGQANQQVIAPPGQHGFGGSLFGQTTSLPEDISNLGLNNRGLTPQQQQQLLLLKSATPQSANLLSNFQSNVAQQQTHSQAGSAPGHGRHASRFSFANDSASASASVQPVANQKLMNQQSSMMPKNSNQFNQLSQHQPLGSPFYASGVQGPPPGLKATGTPPVSGGGMFGQGHGFATSGLGYGANATGRNNNDVMYQDLLRSRNMDGGARLAEAGKRESNFPSFLNQHPTTSTPAPAPGLLSFPYGPSPGAYQESGAQKSKKKGKKHRHANTSSSGGGAVDVQDPSILQARLHQGGMVGQGLYAGQGQDDQVFHPEQPVSIDVDALVDDADFGPPTQPSMVGEILEERRRATPTIPPGLTAPVLPRAPLEPAFRSISQSSSLNLGPAATAPSITPETSATPNRIKGKREAGQTATAGNVDTKQHAKADTPGTSKTRRTVSSTQPLPTSTVEERGTGAVATVDRPLVPNSVEKKMVSKSVTKSKSTANKALVDAAPSSSAWKDASDSSKPAEMVSSMKRQPPGRLDIAAATTLLEDEPTSAVGSTKAEAGLKNPRTVSIASVTSVPPSPVAKSTAMGSPIKRSTAPRTLRVIPTPKSEIPPPLSAVSSTSVPHVPTVDKLRSRQASIASVNLPGTPASELVSDTASVTSASVSRASSPPLVGAKVGSAPVRKKTKSQAKKDRQERAKQLAEEHAALEDHTKSEPEPEQAPILGRMKKTKRPNPSAQKPPAGPLKSQPSSPKPAKVEEAEAEDNDDDDDGDDESRVPPTAASSVKASVAISSTSSPRKSDPSPVVDRASTPDSPKDKDQPTAQSIISDLQRTGELLVSTLEFFKPLSASLAHATRTAQTSPNGAPLDLKIHFSESDLDALAKKKPVRLSGHNGKSDSRTLITPQGKFFWGLTQELEEKALELEKHIEELKGAARFHPRKQSAQSGSHNVTGNAHSKDVLPAIATALKDAGVKLSKNTTAATSNQPMSKLDPTSTLLGSTSLPLPPVQAPVDLASSWLDTTKPLNLPQVSSTPTPTQAAQQPQTPADAIAYLNQFVLPKTDNPLPSAPRTEMAAVGGPPGAGAVNMTVNVNKIAKAAKAVAEGGALPGELEGMGAMAADVLGGVVVQGLEALVGAGLGFHSNKDLSVDGQGNITLGGTGLDVQGLMNAIEAGGLGGSASSPTGQASRRGRRSVLSLDEAEQAMQMAKKDQDALEKKLAGLMKRNKKLLSGNGKN